MIATFIAVIIYSVDVQLFLPNERREIGACQWNRNKMQGEIYYTQCSCFAVFDAGIKFARSTIGTVMKHYEKDLEEDVCKDKANQPDTYRSRYEICFNKK